ncbi:MAG TPA: lysine biosynthesis protein LysW [Vicinamibacteria bacterium]|nr:lysine biosynthesis protein LysW [Vicinamibacteria bacterium]
MIPRPVGGAFQKRPEPRPLSGGVMAVCPECEAEIEIDEYDVDKGEIISCPECGVDLEVVGLSPLELDLAPQEEDDWEE